MGLLLSGREWIDLVAYFPGMPLLHRRLYRNEDRLLALATRIQAFNELIETRMEKVMSV
jgi:23S rRNA A2030 N6-methylase RlmJ